MTRNSGDCAVDGDSFWSWLGRFSRRPIKPGQMVKRKASGFASPPTSLGPLPRIERSGDIFLPLDLTLDQAVKRTWVELDLAATVETLDGAGPWQGRRTFNVQVPAGVDTGTRMKMTGLMAESCPDASGEITLVCRIQEHLFLWRDDIDLHCEVMVSPLDASTGVRLELDVLGKKIVVAVPRRTPDSAEVVARYSGIQGLGTTELGDLHVRIKYDHLSSPGVSR